MSYSRGTDFSNLDCCSGFSVDFHAPPSGIDWSGGFDIIGNQYDASGSWVGDGGIMTSPCF